MHPSWDFPFGAWFPKGETFDMSKLSDADDDVRMCFCGKAQNLQEELIDSWCDIMSYHILLVGGFNPSEKYARQNGNLPQIGVKIFKKYLKLVGA